jgi:hypothetical protein
VTNWKEVRHHVQVRIRNVVRRRGKSKSQQKSEVKGKSKRKNKKEITPQEAVALTGITLTQGKSDDDLFEEELGNEI